MELKNEVKITRKNLGITQNELAAAVGIGRNKMINIELGTVVPDLITCFKISEALNTHILLLWEYTGISPVIL